MVRIFKHYLPTSLLMLGLIELLLLFAALYVGVELRFFGAQPTAEIPIYPLYPKAIVFALVLFSLMVAMGLYMRESEPPAWQYLRVLASFTLGFFAMTVIYYAIPPLFLGRGIITIAFVFSIAGVLLARTLYYQSASVGQLRRRVLVLGTGTRAAKVEAVEKERGAQRGFDVVGYLPLQTENHFVDRHRILSDQGHLCEIARKHNVDEIVVGVRDRRNGGLPVDDVLYCKLNGIQITELSTFCERETGHVQLQALNASWMIFSDGFERGVVRDTVKRLFDLGASMSLFIMTSWLMLITAALIRLDSRGPIFYKQERIGEGGRSFHVYKFRSMRTDAEKGGKAIWAGANDPRVTRVGRLIRTVRIDELPQVLNILRGEMSFVGPRPERPQFVHQLAEQIPYYNYRHQVKPGLTGWAQIRYPYGASFEDAIEKLQYDLYYVKNHSLFLDLVVLFQTAQVVIFGKGAR